MRHAPNHIIEIQVQGVPASPPEVTTLEEQYLCLSPRSPTE